MPTLKAVKAKHGEKTIKVSLNFWTDNIGGKGTVVPKHAWDSGMIYVAANKTHGISTKGGVRFSSLPEISEAVEKALKRAGICLHPSPSAANLKKKSN